MEELVLSFEDVLALENAGEVARHVEKSLRG